MMRLVVALLVAPLAPAVLAAFAVATKVGGFDSDTPAVVALGCLAAGYAAAIVFRLPLSFLWKSLGWCGIAGGVSLGTVSAFCITALPYPFLRLARVQEVSFLEGLVNLLIFTVPLGAIGGLVFWWFGPRSPNISLESDACKATRVSS